jgi:NTE family protein
MSCNELVPPSACAACEDGDGDLAVMLTGGGARAAYQVGLLKGLTRNFPSLRFQIITGVSAGAINAIFLASREGTLAKRVDDLADVWCELVCDHIFRFDALSFLPFRSAFKSQSHPRALDTTPLGKLLQRVFDCRPGEPIEGIIRNLSSGDISAVALMTLDYTTGQCVRWFQGREIDGFEGPNRRSEQTQLTLEHVLASSALPFLFPAICIGNRWYGDGGIRLAAPLSPAVHLGASRIIAMSTGYRRRPHEASTPVVNGYPPAAQIASQLVNAVFLDVIDEDVERMARMNELLLKIPPEQRDGLKPIDLLVLRPSVDLGALAASYEHRLPRNVRLLTRALGARESESPDFLSMLMFEPSYTQCIIDIGERDVDRRMDEIRAFLGHRPNIQLAV